MSDNIRDEMRAESVFMCVNCSVTRWGYPDEPCPVCGEMGVDKLVFSDDAK